MVHLIDGLYEIVHEDRVAHLPDRQDSAFNETFNSIVILMGDHFRALARFGHSLEDSMLYVFVDDLVFNFTVKNSPRGIRVTQFDAFVKGDLVARIAQPVQLLDLELIQRVMHSFSPAWHMLLDVIEDNFCRLTAIFNEWNLVYSSDPRV